MKASEDKTFPGAIVAAPASPWGQAISAGDPANTFFGSYREVFARDLYEIWTGLMADGDTATARDATLFLFNSQQQADGSMPRNSLLNGKAAPDSFGTQLDETSYPLLMADELHLTDPSLYANHIKPAANFVASHGPAFGVERWEEQDGYSPSTIAAEIAGLVAAADLADANHDPVSAAVWRGVADDYQRSIKGWTVTTTGPLAPRYFIRLSKTGDPNAAISYNVGNGGPTLDQRSVIDAGFLELARLGELPPTDPDILASLPVVDATISSDTPSGPGWHRYNGDGYGDRSSDGRPWAPSGVGHRAPLAGAQRRARRADAADRQRGRSCVPPRRHGPIRRRRRPHSRAGLGAREPRALALRHSTRHRFDRLRRRPARRARRPRSTGRLPRSSGCSPTSARAACSTGRRARTSAISRTPRATTSLTVTSPADQSAVSGSPVTVTGTTAPGNKVYVSATNTDQLGHDDRDGHRRRSRCVQHPRRRSPAGRPFSTLSRSAGAAARRTCNAPSSSISCRGPSCSTSPTRTATTTAPATTPTRPSDNFKPGAFDIQDFQVYDAGTDVIFRLKVRDLTPTFGSPLGAQLVDVYVHVPGAAHDLDRRSERDAQLPDRAGVRLEPPDPGARLRPALRGRLGHAAGHGGDQREPDLPIHHLPGHEGVARHTRPRAGASRSSCTGQDGFSSDQARGFQPTPQDFQFGVCAAASADPHCTFNPGLVPKPIDVLTPPGVLQSDELDYTLHNPVVITGVTIP